MLSRTALKKRRRRWEAAVSHSSLGADHTERRNTIRCDREIGADIIRAARMRFAENAIDAGLVQCDCSCRSGYAAAGDQNSRHD